MYNTDKFFEYLYRKVSDERSEINSIDDIEKEREKVRKMLCFDKLEQMSEVSVACDISVPDSDEKNLCEVNVRRCEITFLPKLTAPFWILNPENPNGKAVLYCHGHDRHGAKGAFVKYKDSEEYHKFLALHLVKHGYTVVIPEFIGYGELQYDAYSITEQRGCYSNVGLSQLFGLNLAGLRVFEAKVMLDYLIDDMKFSDVSVFGTSGGGLISAFLGAIDDRLTHVVVSNYGASLKSSIMKIHHCMDNYIADYLTVGEAGNIMSLAFPKKLLLTNGIADDIFPVQGVCESAEVIRTAYKRLGGENNFKLNIHDGGHEISVEAVIDFLSDE